MDYFADRRECIRCQGEFPEDAFPPARANLECGRSLLCGACLAAVKWPRRVAAVAAIINPTRDPA